MAMTPQRVDGFLVLDKPSGMSSMQAVARVRHRAGRTKTGHGGTLDPLATGVLVLGLGKATRLLDQVVATTKGYCTEIDLSFFTATDDLEGEPEPVEVGHAPDRSMVEAALSGFAGETMQAPPRFSAVKIGGRRAYALARRNQAVQPEPRPVVTHDLRIVAYDWPVVTIDITCGKGFYVRSLARDLGTALGTGGCCRSIRRTAVGPFTIDEAHTLDDLPETIGSEDVISIQSGLARLTL